MKTPRLLIGLLTLFLLLQPTSAETSLAMVTKVKGEGTAQGQKLKLLSYLAEGDKAKITSDSEFVFSYISGGLRAKIVGPCQVEFKKSGPVLLSGKKDQLTISRPKKRVGVALPSDLALGEGGHIRRGELSLHLSRKLLPGEQTIKFSGLPSFETFHLVISNASTYADVFENEVSKGQEFNIPKGTLRPGQSYDFLLQATTNTGQTMEVEAESVVVLSEDIASQLAGFPVPASVGAEQFPEATEVLSIYLTHGLDAEALQITQVMLKTAGDNPRLLEIEKNLKQRLQFAD